MQDISARSPAARVAPCSRFFNLDAFAVRAIDRWASAHQFRLRGHRDARCRRNSAATSQTPEKRTDDTSLNLQMPGGLTPPYRSRVAVTGLCEAGRFSPADMIDPDQDPVVTADRATGGRSERFTSIASVSLLVKSCPTDSDVANTMENRDDKNNETKNK